MSENPTSLTGPLNDKSFKPPHLLRAAAELVYVLPERGRGQLNRFGHCREDMHRVDDVVDSEVVLDCQNCLVDNVSSAVREDVNSKYPSGRGLSNHFDQSSSLSNDDGLWHLSHWYRSACAFDTVLMGP